MSVYYEISLKIQKKNIGNTHSNQEIEQRKNHIYTIFFASSFNTAYTFEGIIIFNKKTTFMVALVCIDFD